MKMRYLLMLLVVVGGIVAVGHAADLKEVAVTLTKKATGEVTKAANLTQGYTEERVKKYKEKLNVLTKLRQKAKADIEKEPDQGKKQKIAVTFYKEQQKYLNEMLEDVTFTNQKIDGLYGTIRIAMGGYGKAEGSIDRESQAFQNKDSLIKDRNKLKNEATLLLGKKMQLPKDSDGAIDQTTEAFFKFADEEDAFMEKYKDIGDAIKRCDWKLTHYGRVKQALRGHKKQASQWSGHARRVNSKYKSLKKDIETQLEIVADMIAIGGINGDLAELASYGKVTKEVDIMIKQLSDMGFLTDITIPKPPIDGGEGGGSGGELTLEQIAAGTPPASSGAKTKDKDKNKTK